MNVQELLENRNIEFKATGNDYLISCLNPEHIDEHPSLSIDRDTGVFHCFSCKFKGDIFQHFNIYKDLADQKAAQMKKKIHNLYYRPITMPLGAMPYDRKYRGISVRTLTKFKAFTHSDDFPNRLVFPIYNNLEQLVCFHARIMHSEIKEKKYINSPAHIKLPLYPAYPEDLSSKSIILVEGLFDMLSLYDKGIKNAVCMFGTSLSTRSHKKQKENLKKLDPYILQGARKIYLMLDSDDAGRQAANVMEKYLKNYILTEILEMPEGLDPCTLEQDFIVRIKEKLSEDSNYRQSTK